MVPAASRRRLDQLLVERGLVANRTRARALILAGRVFRGEERLDKPGLNVPGDVEVEVRAGRQHVGRGALKLIGALDSWPMIEVSGRRAIDIGSSTGGFSEVLLDRGAAEVIALDVGRGQLDWSLRQREAVHVMEGVNARYMKPDDLPFTPELLVMDVSFISLEKVWPAVFPCLAEGADAVCLVKPQFEVGRDAVGRGGIVRDPALHREVLVRLVGFAASRGWRPRACLPSPIRGADGNREYFLWLQPRGEEFEVGLEFDGASLDAALAEIES